MYIPDSFDDFVVLVRSDEFLLVAEVEASVGFSRHYNSKEAISLGSFTIARCEGIVPSRTPLPPSSDDAAHPHFPLGFFVAISKFCFWRGL